MKRFRCTCSREKVTEDRIKLAYCTICYKPMKLVSFKKPIDTEGYDPQLTMIWWKAKFKKFSDQELANAFSSARDEIRDRAKLK